MTAAVVISLGWVSIIIFICVVMMHNRSKEQAELKRRERIWVETGMTLEEYEAFEDYKENYRW